MFTKVSILVPTRGRIGRLRTLISSFDVTTGNLPNAELVFRVDDDDQATLDFLLAWGGHKVVVGPRLEGYRSMPSFFNELALESSGDVLMCGNDDMVFETLGWPALLLAKANEYPDGLFNIGVSVFNEDHYPWCIVGRKIVDVLGFLWDPTIFWGDIYLRDVMGTLGRTVKFPDVKITHDWAGYTPDQTFNESNKNVGADYWIETHKTAVAAAVAKLRGAV